MTKVPHDASDAFVSAASATLNAKRPRKKKPSPFCLRLSSDERARLEHEAGDMPLGAYIRFKVLSEAAVRLPRSRPRRPLKDQQALGTLLGMLGASRLPSNINQLAKAANTGSLPVTPETEAALKRAAYDIACMRELLLKALGQKPGAGLGAE